jgi:hypothetical protein
VAFEVAEICLAHESSAVVAAYQRDGLIERRRKVMEDWSRFLDGAAEEDEVVIQWRGRAAS